MSITQTKGAIIATGEGVSVFQAITIKTALKLYAKTGIKANRAYTPKAMMTMAEKITGQKFRARDYLGAVAGLETWIDERKEAGA
ncbi:hypothetical protein KEU06_09435 [Pseudaminobacter sp. 19-2017]|uniref:Uncharacterized protein n=1 Tax=Pseudaminobacter soli (ex Zhang et al. 2022) TaxID=2831468 RepID=A0A942I201_9HYPH|nr:hypothetical protein [Pseudaminobacter soli]MBS3648827.1 hypothetical protein [Pseudaminobacter soli]